MFPTCATAAILDFQDGRSHMPFLHISASRRHKLPILVAKHMFLGTVGPMATIKTYKYVTKIPFWLARMEFSRTYVTFLIPPLGKKGP